MKKKTSYEVDQEEEKGKGKLKEKKNAFGPIHEQQQQQ